MEGAARTNLSTLPHSRRDRAPVISESRLDRTRARQHTPTSNPAHTRDAENGESLRCSAADFPPLLQAVRQGLPIDRRGFRLYGRIHQAIIKRRLKKGFPPQTLDKGFPPKRKGFPPKGRKRALDALTRPPPLSGWGGYLKARGLEGDETETASQRKRGGGGGGGGGIGGGAGSEGGGGEAGGMQSGV